MDNFVYDVTTKVYFGRGEEEKVGKLIAGYGAKKVLVHYGSGSVKKSGLLDKVKASLEAEKIPYVELGGVVANPELPLVRKGIALCLEEGVDFVLAVGGGSVLDSAKDIANGAANPDIDVWDFSMGKAQPAKTLHKGAILTLAAAGSEMSNSCVITNPETGRKAGYNSSMNRMDFAIENPELTFTVSPYQTACGAVDIAMHTMERYFCLGEDTYLTDAVAEAVMKTTLKAGIDSYRNPTDYTARANMMWASSLAHNGLTQCGRSFQLTVHQFEHEVSGMYPQIAHGAGLAALWCSWARYVYKETLPRFIKWARNVWNIDVDPEHPEVSVLKAIELQERYYKELNMPTSLHELDVRKEDLEKLALNCSRDKTRILNGYKKLGYEEMLDIFNLAY
ncbi:MAG: iron-containing alcohol dehydrogenase [Treponemataceae bacterium]|nr:iron-containing alcohol dehydrogenase [Treponemataceae bacterium]